MKIILNKEYLNKTELTKLWSNSLIKKYFPKCSLEETNPHYKCAPPMQLYEVSRIRDIESKEAFKADFEKVKKRKIAAIERAEKKRNELIKYVNALEINIPTMKKGKLIKKACAHYNNWNEWKEYEDFYYSRATPSCDESFLKRITLNYLRHNCTCYESELQKLFGKVGKGEAYFVLKDRINEAIKDKYEWLK